METINSYEGWIGTDAYDVNGDKIGAIDAIYYDDQTGRPEWMAIRTGFFGLNTSFVPMAGGTIRNGGLHLPYTKAQVKDAPNVEPNGHLDADEERDLFEHYGFSWDARSYGVGERFDSEYDVADQSMRREAEVAETTRSEERLRVGTEKVATGKARLRKYVVTEHQNVTVPVTREEVRVERQPITDGEADEIGDDEAEITTYAERPVVSTEKVAKEKVRLVKETVADDETVSGDVRKEQIEVEVDEEALPPRH